MKQITILPMETTGLSERGSGLYLETEAALEFDTPAAKIASASGVILFTPRE
jgi:hypothetical protein